MYQNKIAQLQTHVVIVNITCNTMNPMKYTKTSMCGSTFGSFVFSEQTDTILFTCIKISTYF